MSYTSSHHLSDAYVAVIDRDRGGLTFTPDLGKVVGFGQPQGGEESEPEKSLEVHDGKWRLVGLSM